MLGDDVEVWFNGGRIPGRRSGAATQATTAKYLQIDKVN